MDGKGEEQKGIEVVDISPAEEKKLFAYLERMEEAVAKEEGLPPFIKE